MRSLTLHSKKELSFLLILFWLSTLMCSLRIGSSVVRLWERIACQGESHNSCQTHEWWNKNPLIRCSSRRGAFFYCYFSSIFRQIRLYSSGAKNKVTFRAYCCQMLARLSNFWNHTYDKFMTMLIDIGRNPKSMIVSVKNQVARSSLDNKSKMTIAMKLL